jgi:hypothetical protein
MGETFSVTSWAAYVLCPSLTTRAPREDVKLYSHSEQFSNLYHKFGILQCSVLAEITRRLYMSTTVSDGRVAKTTETMENKKWDTEWDCKMRTQVISKMEYFIYMADPYVLPRCPPCSLLRGRCWSCGRFEDSGR